MTELLASWWLSAASTPGLDQVGACLLLSALPLALPRILARPWLAPFSCAAAAVVYGSRLPGLVLTCAVAYLFTWRISCAGTDRPARMRQWRWAGLGIIALVVAFLAGRSAGLDVWSIHAGPIDVFVFVLNMWLALRLVTLLWEVGSGKVERPRLDEFIIWCGLPFLAFGPLLRYSEFQRSLRTVDGQVGNRLMFAQSAPKLVGLAAVQIATAVALLSVQTAWTQSSAHAGWQTIAMVFLTSPWSFYLLTAGTFKMMEASALAWGIRIQPSFRNPFGQLNLSAFWSQWNVTATAVFRDYLFYTRWGFKTANVYANLIILFVLVGAWHGFNPYWLMWGLYHGLGFVAFTLWRKHRSQIPAVPLPGSLARPLSWAMTYIFVCAGWAVPTQVLKLLGRTIT